MAEKLGKEISESCYSLLSCNNSARRNFVIILLTVDESGFPRICLLSPFQVLSANRSEIYFVVHPDTHTKKNLDWTNKATLIIPESIGLLYVRGETKYLEDLKTPSEESQALYSMKVVEVSRDSSEDAPINSQMMFDVAVIGPRYQRNFEALVGRLKSVSKHDLDT
jgi:hypothetical protein